MASPRDRTSHRSVVEADRAVQLEHDKRSGDVSGAKSGEEVGVARAF
jgi:hypothetical protein